MVTKHHYRVVDFVRNKDGIPAKVERIEYDPNRTAHIALCAMPTASAATSSRRVALEAGATMSGAEAPIKAGNTLPIRNIPVGSTIHCVEMLPGKGADRALGRHLGDADGARGHLRAGAPALGRGAQDPHRLPRHHRRGRNEEHNLRQYGKAGAIRWKGIRPTVRGVAMNPIDHPHGGGEGRTGEGRRRCRRGTR